MPYYRSGMKCRRGDKCKHAHIPIDRLTPASQRTWREHVQATECLCFNPRRVKSMAAELLQPASGAAGAAAERNKRAVGAAAKPGDP